MDESAKQWFAPQMKQPSRYLPILDASNWKLSFEDVCRALTGNYSPEYQPSLTSLTVFLSEPPHFGLVDTLMNRFVVRKLGVLLTSPISYIKAEATRVWVNLTAGSSATQDNILMQTDVVKILFSLMTSSKERVVEHASGAIANLFGGFSSQRNYQFTMVCLSALNEVLALIPSLTSSECIVNVMRIVHNILRQPLFLQEEKCSVALYLLPLLNHSNFEVKRLVCWSLLYCAGHDADVFWRAIGHFEEAKRLLECLQSGDPALCIPTSMLFSTREKPIRSLIPHPDADNVPSIIHCAVKAVMGTVNPSVLRLAVQFLRRITSSTFEDARQRENIKENANQIMRSGVLSPLLDLVKRASIPLKYVAADVLLNLLIIQVPEHVKEICEKGGIRTLCDLLRVHDMEWFIKLTEAIRRIRHSGLVNRDALDELSQCFKSACSQVTFDQVMLDQIIRYDLEYIIDLEFFQQIFPETNSLFSIFQEPHSMDFRLPLWIRDPLRTFPKRFKPLSGKALPCPDSVKFQDSLLTHVVAKKMESQSPDELIDVLRMVRRILSPKNEVLLSRFVELDLLGKCVKCLDSEDPDVQFEALLTLNHVLFLKRALLTDLLIVVPRTVQLSGSTVEGIVEQSFLLLGNIAITGRPSAGGMATVYIGVILAACNFFSKPIFKSQLKTVLWTVSSALLYGSRICRWSELCWDAQGTRRGLGECSQGIANCLKDEDSDVLVLCCWLISLIAENQAKEHQDELLRFVDMERAVNLMLHEDADVAVRAIGMCSNLFTLWKRKPYAPRDPVLEFGVLRVLKDVITAHPTSLVVAEAVRWLSFLCEEREYRSLATPQSRFVRKLFKSGIPSSFKRITAQGQCCRKCHSYVRRLFRSLCRLVSRDACQNVQALVGDAAMTFVCDMFTFYERCFDSQAFFEGFECLLQAWKGCGVWWGDVCTKLKECGMVERLSQLQQHDDLTIAYKAYETISKFVS